MEHGGELWRFVFEVLAVLGAAFAAGALAERLRQSALVGYILAGVALGSLVFRESFVVDVAELGVALLLFSIGLEFSLTRLRSVGKIAVLGGTLQVSVTTALFALLCLPFLPGPAAVAAGAMAALSSTAVVIRVLADRAELDAVHGRDAVGLLLLQDIAVVPLVLLVTVLSSDGGAVQVIWRMLALVAAAAAVVGLFHVLFNRVVPRLLNAPGVRRNRELVHLLTLILGIGSAWVSQRVGLSPGLGAFLAGMLLAESPFAPQIRSDIGPIRTVFVTFFFTSIGMLADPLWILGHLPAVLVAVALIFAVKSAVIAAIARAFGRTRRDAVAAGVALGQVGEFSFVLAGIAAHSGLFDEPTFALFASATIFSLILSPYMVAYARLIAAFVDRRLAGAAPSPTPARSGAASEDACSALVVGFGPAGRLVADELLKQGVRIAVIEQNPESAAYARSLGVTVHTGDGASPDVLEHAGAGGARVVVVTVPDTRVARSVISGVRRVAHDAPIVARGRYHRHIGDLLAAGAGHVVDEERQVGRALARVTVERLFPGTAEIPRGDDGDP